jgi:hypothetical protein
MGHFKSLEIFCMVLNRSETVITANVIAFDSSRLNPIFVMMLGSSSRLMGSTDSCVKYTA